MFNFNLNLLITNMKKNLSSKKKSKSLKIEYEVKENLDQSISQENTDSQDEIYEIPCKEKNTTSKPKSKLEMLKNYEKEFKDKPDEIKNNFWRDWERLEKMRGKIEAPVDTMGVEFVSDPNLERKVFKFQSLIGLLLSSQTKDPITYAVMNKLIKHGLTVESINQTDEDTIKEMIYGVSFHNNKTKYIKQLASVLHDKYNGDPPEKFQDVIELPGIGPKMAHLYMQCCCDKIEGIAVDTHVHRICNRLKWTNNTKTPEQTRKELESWLPKKYWVDINFLLVGFGQTICKAVGPKCEECLLNTTCEFGINRLKEKSKSKKSRSLPKLQTTELKLEDKSKKPNSIRKSKRKNSDTLNNNILANKRKKKK